jgi:hypothetical protein
VLPASIPIPKAASTFPVGLFGSAVWQTAQEA